MGIFEFVAMSGEKFRDILEIADPLAEMISKAVPQFANASHATGHAEYVQMTPDATVAVLSDSAVKLLQTSIDGINKNLEYIIRKIKDVGDDVKYITIVEDQRSLGEANAVGGDINHTINSLSQISESETMRATHLNSLSADRLACNKLLNQANGVIEGYTKQVHTHDISNYYKKMARMEIWCAVQDICLEQLTKVAILEYLLNRGEQSKANCLSYVEEGYESANEAREKLHDWHIAETSAWEINRENWKRPMPKPGVPWAIKRRIREYRREIIEHQMKRLQDPTKHIDFNLLDPNAVLVGHQGKFYMMPKSNM